MLVKTKLKFGLIVSLIFFLSNISHSQNYVIKAGCNLCADAKGRQLIDYIIANKLQTLEGGCKTVDPITVNFNLNGNKFVDFGNGNQSEFNQTLTDIFTNWTLTECIAKGPDTTFIEKPKRTSIFAPLTYIPERIAANWDIRTTLSDQYRYLSSLDYYVNPYFQAFGGEPLGLPIAYGAGVGLLVGFGTPYSGPMETDFVKGGLHFALFDVSVTGRVKEFVLKYSNRAAPTENTKNTWIGNWNNLFAPHLGMDFAIEVPFVRLSYFATLDTLQDVSDNPVIVRNEVTGQPMRNNVIRGQYFGFEIRTPNLIFYNSTRAKFYFAKQFGEYHLGYAGREMKIDNFIFDFRMDATFPGKRDFQLLTELYLDSPWPGFANKAFGFGPSIRLGKTPSNSFGLISAFINARIKIGDFFDKNLY